MEPENKIIKHVYAAFVVSLFMTFVPNVAAAVIAFILFLGVLITAYVLRAKAEDESLIHNHMTFIIRTIWIAGLFGIFTIGAASAYLFGNLDVTTFYHCVEQNGGANTTDITALHQITQLCMDDYITANKGVLLTATIIAATPLVLYMLYRMAKGIARAAKGHRIGDNKNWF